MAPASESVDIHRAIIEESSDAIIYADRAGLIRLWNRGAELLFGHTPAEALGQRLDLIIPERLQRAHWEGFQRALDTGEGKYRDRVLTTRSVHKSGSTLYVDLGFGLVKDASGTVIGAFAVGRDCTARYTAERDLKARVQALEKRAEDADKTP